MRTFSYPKFSFLDSISFEDFNAINDKLLRADKCISYTLETLLVRKDSNGEQEDFTPKINRHDCQ